MELNRKQKVLVDNLISEWLRSGLIGDDLASSLKASVSMRAFDWARLARYAFWLAVLSAVFALATLLADEWISKLIARLFAAPKLVLSALFALPGALSLFLSWRLSRRDLRRIFSIGFLQLLGAVFLGIALFHLVDFFEQPKYEVPLILVLATLCYGGLAAFFRSGALWLSAIFALLSAFISFSYEWSQLGDYFLGMNFPLRATVFTAMLAATCWFEPPGRWYGRFSPLTRKWSLWLFLFFSWLLSISGNLPDYGAWEGTKQIHLAFWALGVMGLTMGILYAGLKGQNQLLRGSAFVFILLHVYTRYVEYFWNPMHKAFFFLLLAASFWFMGTRAEKLWRGEMVGWLDFSGKKDQHLHE